MTPYRQQPPPIVILAFGGRVIGTHAHDGRRLWELDLGENRSDGARMLIDRDRVLALMGDVLVGLDYATGEVLFKTRVPDVLRGPRATLIVCYGVVVLASLGEAAGFSREDGSLLWHDGFKGYGLDAVALAAPGVAAQFDRRD